MDMIAYMMLTEMLKAEAREDIRRENEFLDEDDPQQHFFEEEEEEKEERPFTVNTFFGTYKVSASIDRYRNNRNLAIQLWEDEGPFATLTVNLSEKLPSNQAYVDTNNCPWAEEFIETNGLGRSLGRWKQSGYCMYPLYEFDLEKMEG